MATLIPRDPDLARRLGLSAGIVREVERLAARSGGSRTPGRAGSQNPWLSQNQSPLPRENYAQAMLREMERRERSSDLAMSLAEELARAVIRMHPLGRMLDNALLLRELLRMLGGETAVDGSGPSIPSYGGIVFPPGWVEVCAGSMSGVGPGRASIGGLCGVSGWTFEATWPADAIGQPTAAFMAASGAFNGLTATFAKDLGRGPDVGTQPTHLFQYQRSMVWQGGTLAAPASAAQWSQGASAAPGVSPYGLGPQGATEASRRLRKAASRLMLPNMQLSAENMAPGDQQDAADGLREQLGLREAVEPLPALRDSAGELVNEWADEVPGIRAETHAGRWRMSQPHKYARDKFKTKKMKLVGPGWQGRGRRRSC